MSKFGVNNLIGRSLFSYSQTGDTPLWKASFNGHQKCVELLVEAGANVYVPRNVSVTSCTHILVISVGPLDSGSEPELVECPVCVEVSTAREP